MYEIKQNEEKYNLVYRKQGYFCNRCGARVEKMYEGKLVRFEEDHTCKPEDVLKRKIEEMNNDGPLQRWRTKHGYPQWSQP